MRNIASPTPNLPHEAPVMALPNAVLFPHALLPLFLFEERYKRMVAHCLEGDRMFCVALMKAAHSGIAGEEDFFRIAGLGLIRACVENPDGTSHLILQGIIRVQLVETVSAETPFPIARIRAVPSDLSSQIEAEALSAKVVELSRSLTEKGREIPPALAQQLPHLTDPDVLSDIVAHTFVRDPFQRQLLLAEQRVPDRLRLLIRCLQSDLDAA